MSGMYRRPDPAPQFKPMHHVPGAASDEKAGRSVSRSVNIILGIAVGMAFLAWLLFGCAGTNPPPLPCPPWCVVTATPVPGPQETPTPKPTGAATRTVTATPTSTPTRTPGAATPFQTTGGRAVIVLDLASFRVVPNLDYYAAASLTWEAPGALKPETPALELAIRGTSDEHCLEAPCTKTALGLTARWSCNIRHDAGEPDEKRHVGEGINYRYRLPIGPGPTTKVYVEWGPDARRVRVSTDWGIWTAKRGVRHPGFGFFYEGIPNPPKGIGWARSPWLIQRNGGTASLVSWETVAPLAVLTGCP